jgi:prohibitin 2
MDNQTKIVVSVVVLLVVAFALFSSFFTVENGEVGFIKRFGKLSETPLEAGLHMKLPFVDTVETVSVVIEKAEVEAAAASSDAQHVSSKVVVNYQISPANAYYIKNVLKNDVDGKAVMPSIQDAVKAVTAQYKATELLAKRDEVSSKIMELLTKKLSDFQITVKGLNIVNFEFSDSFNASIEAKQVAEQQSKKAEYDLNRIKIEAEQKIAQAKAEAEALRLKKAEITPELVKLKEIEVQEKAIDKWDGKLPNVTGGTVPFINVGGATGNSSSTTTP